MFKKYWPMALVALAVGVFSVLPLLFSLQRMGNSFQGIWPQFNGDANFYLARARESLDGHRDMNHPYYFEHKNDTYTQANGGELFLAWLAEILDVSIPDLQAALDFIAPALMAALFYLLLFAFYPSRLISFFISLLFFTVITGGMTKPIHPEISFPLLLVFLISWLGLALDKVNKTVSVLLCGLILGALFLVYFFHWSFLLVVLGVYGLVLVVRKDYRELKYHAIFIAIAGMVALPFFIRAVTATSSRFYEETAVRMGVFATHWPETWPRLAVALAWLMFFVFVTRYYKLNRDKYSHVLFSLLLANIIYPNHQIITGVTIENANHWSFMPVFIYALATHYLIHTIIKHASKPRSILDKTVIGIIIVMLVVPAWRLQSFNFPPYLRSLSRPAAEESQQKYVEILRWLQNNAPRDAVVFSHLGFMRLVPIFTHANVYYSENGYYLLGSDQEIIERTLLARFFDIEKFKAANFGLGEVPRILWTQTAMIERNTHVMHDWLGIPYEKKYTLERELGLVKSVLAGLEADGWNIDLLRRYKLDYIVWDQSLFPEWKLESYGELKKIYEKDNMAVFIFKT